MITTWLKMWAEQAASRAERKQRFALIEANFPHARVSSFRPVSKHREAARSGRPPQPMEVMAS